MGHGTYSVSDRTLRATSMGYYSNSMMETFSERNINNAMSPSGLGVRESRDSNEHPNSLAIILGLDVTGSMGSIPHFMVKDGLPHIMGNIIEHGLPDPQVMFLGVGDHKVDSAPIQVGQFESSDELMDHWLTKVYLESGGGGNAGESYMLAWYVAAFHTSIDCLEKRRTKGLLFTVGDEPVLPTLDDKAIKTLFDDDRSTMSSTEILDAAREKYDVYHLHLRQGSNGQREDVMNGWLELLGDNLIIIDRKEQVADRIAEIVIQERSDMPSGNGTGRRLRLRQQV